MSLAVISEQNRVERDQKASRMRNSGEQKILQRNWKRNQLEGEIRRTALDSNFSKVIEHQNIYCKKQEIGR